MSTGPLRRTVGVLGLLAIVPIAIQLGVGAIEPEAAAQRAAVVAIVAVVLGRLASRVVAGTLRRVERDVVTEEPSEV
ncbi:hypothetical protein FTX61_18180 [Nitriliruptoraceae bacterium ZYF776]|nr:hypothetical protein [Profundirhabdus halotolerans]